MADSKQINPLQNLFADIKKILEYIEIKDKEQADKYETEDSQFKAGRWMNAMVQSDSYITYKDYWTYSMFQNIKNNVRYIDYTKYIENPYSVPLVYQESLREQGRNAFLASYEEENEYYRMLNGLPPIGTSEKDYVYMSDEMYEKYHCDKIPVHKLTSYVQNAWMNTDEYQEVLQNNSSKTYLKYLGMNKIDIFSARKAKDFDIIRYPLNRSDINPNLVNTFASLYADYREYVMVVLYNREFESLYHNYRNFMGVLIMYFTLMQIGNKAVEAIHSRNYLDDTILHIILSMYGIPDSLLLPADVRRNLAINILKLVREKGTNEVYYDLIQILGYENVTISKLMLMKGQQFENGIAKNSYDPYFLQIDLKDENPYKTITNGNAPRYDYKSIIDNDPTWWDDDNVRKILREKPYTMADTKYIVINAEIQQMKYAFESIYFTRLILDNQPATENFMIEVPELFGSTLMSIYDLMVYVLCATCMVNGMKGEIISDEERLLATAGFNFNLDQDAFNEFLSTTQYIDKDRLNKFMENLTIIDQGDITRLFDNVMVPLREWLENKISSASIRQEYIEYEAVYRALFTYDINRNPFEDDFELPIETIKSKYNIPDEDMNAFKHFYPQTMDGKCVTINEYNETNNTSRYKYPFGGATHPISWYVEWFDESNNKQYLYFHDILNSNDIRWLKDDHGDLIFMKYEDEIIGFEPNQFNINAAREALQKLNSKELNTAVFQEFTPGSGVIYNYGQKLPASIRAEVFKNILIDKFESDIDGLAEQPKTYLEYLRRRNTTLYDKLIKDNRFERNNESWMNDVMTVILAIESELSLHLKYFEQSVLGESLFFKPLITLIKHFKSSLVQIARTGLKYVFDDKVDLGGNSNMLKLFDELNFSIHFTTIKSAGYDSSFGLYDTEHVMHHYVEFNDRIQAYKQMIGYGFAAEEVEIKCGSIHLSDEAKFMKNGVPLDDVDWLTSDERMNEDDHILVARRTTDQQIDFESWKELVPPYCPQ